MPPIDTEGLRKLLAEATPGPWEECGIFGIDSIPYSEAIDRDPEATTTVCDRLIDIHPDCDHGQCDRWEADRALIVAAVNNLPALLSELDAARTALRDEQLKFQQETRRTSELAVLLRRIADEIVTWDGPPGDFSRRELAREIDALLAKPINADDAARTGLDAMKQSYDAAIEDVRTLGRRLGDAQAAIRPVVEEGKSKAGADIHIDNWNQDAHVELTLTIAELRALDAALSEFAAREGGTR